MHTSFDQNLCHLVQEYGSLQELNIWSYGCDILCQSEHLIHMWLESLCFSHCLTLSEMMQGVRGSVLAQVTVGRQHHSGSGVGMEIDIHGHGNRQPSVQGLAQDDPAGLEFLHWDCDHLSSPLSAYLASFLAMATWHNYLVLTMFTLHISSLSRIGLAHIENVLHRSRLERLEIECTSFNPNLSSPIAQLVGSIQWPTLKCLILSGNNIDQWIQLWPATNDPWPLSLNICGTGSAPHDLSHTTVLFIHKIMYTSPPMECDLLNFQLQDKRDS